MTERIYRDHLIGIGGTGMSALACLLQEKGESVSGCDAENSHRLQALKDRGIPVNLGHDASHPDKAERLVVSAAVDKNHVEVRRARELGLPILTRGERLAELASSLETLAVAGSHGKTTTTCMLREIFLAAGLDPSFYAGAAPEGKSQGHWGKDRLLITEADESDGSFLLLKPKHVILTNCDGDHLDFWGDREGALRGFGNFIGGMTPGGYLVVDAEDSGTQSLLSSLDRPCIRVGFGPGADYYALCGKEKLGENRFRMYDRRGTLGDVTLRVPGRHNVKNALMAGAMALEMGLELRAVQTGLAAFSGAERRFGRKTVGGILLVDDYAHHPAEIRATLRTLRNLHPGRIFTVFEPHRYSRLSRFFEELTESFDLADTVMLVPVFGAGEAETAVNSRMLAHGLKKRQRAEIFYMENTDELIFRLIERIHPGDAVLFLGPGGIGGAAQKLEKALQSK